MSDCDVEGRVLLIQKLLMEPLGPEWKGKTVSEFQRKLEEIMRRPVWIHEIGYPEILIKELRQGKPMDAFKESLDVIAREKPVLVVVASAKPFPGCTCNDCPSAKDGTCEYAYDPYNTDGDCLAVK